jgi:hypothetical protein
MTVGRHLHSLRIVCKHAVLAVEQVTNYIIQKRSTVILSTITKERMLDPISSCTGHLVELFSLVNSVVAVLLSPDFFI